MVSANIKLNESVPLGANHLEPEVDMTSPAASFSASEIILEDLANQILKKTSEEKTARQSREQLHPFQLHDSGTTDLLPLNQGNFVGQSIHEEPSRHQIPEKVYMHEASPNFMLNGRNRTIQAPVIIRNGSKNDEDETMTTLHLTASTPLPYMHVIAMSSNQPTTFEATSEDDESAFGSSNETSASDGRHSSSMIRLKDYEEDRHINYDTGPVQNVLFSNAPTSMGQDDVETGSLHNQAANHSNLVASNSNNHLPSSLFNYEADQWRSKLDAMDSGANTSTFTSDSSPDIGLNYTTESTRLNSYSNNSSLMSDPPRQTNLNQLRSISLNDSETSGEKLDNLNPMGRSDRRTFDTSDRLPTSSSDAEPMTSTTISTLTLTSTPKPPPGQLPILTLTSSSANNSSAVKSMTGDELQNQQQIGGANVAQRSATIQARSMGSHLENGSPVSISGPLNRLLQHHSKAPYASNYQSHFHNGASTAEMGPILDNGLPKLISPLVSSSSRQVDSELSLESRNSNKNLVNSINRISSDLATDFPPSSSSSFSSSSSSTPHSSGQVDLSKVGANTRPEVGGQSRHPVNGNGNTVSNRQSESQMQLQMPQPIQPAVTAEQQQQLQKLATSMNQFVDLTPIPILSSPSSSMQSGGSSGEIMSGEMPNRYFDHSTISAVEFQQASSGSGGGSLPTLASTQRFGNGQNNFAAGDSTTTLRVSYPTKIAHDFKNESLQESIVQENEKFLLKQKMEANSLPPVSLHRKTIESVGNQLLDSVNLLNFLGGSDHLPSIVNEDNFQRRNGYHNHGNQHQKQQGNFAASLINVTAPMTPPISATEAMESSLDQQEAKNLLHQASGFLGHTQLNGTIGGMNGNGNSHRIYNSQNITRQQQQQQQRQFTSTSPSSLLLSTTETQPRVYPQPANYFSPNFQTLKQSSYTSSTANHANQEFNESLAANERPSRYGDLREPMNTRAPSSYLSSSGSDMLSQAQSHLNSNSNKYNNHDHQQHHGAQASGFRSPAGYMSKGNQQQQDSPVATLFHSANPSSSMSTSSPAAASGNGQQQQQQRPSPTHQPTTAVPEQMPQPTMSPSTTTTVTQLSTTANPTINNGFITGTVTNSVDNVGGGVGGNPQANPTGAQQEVAIPSTTNGATGGNSNANRRVFNLTRVEHISAECSNDLIKTVIMFNGTFKGIIYSSGFVREPNCLYINGTGKTRYDFSIRLNQCGTLSRSDLHPPAGPNEVRRRDQVMWNTLSIQYNPIIEQEWDEHFRVSCEYGSDFWKTVSFSPFNVETNTGSPIVFTVDPPKCQMEILKGHGMVGPRQEAISGPVTVGDPLTLLIHMKSERGKFLVDLFSLELLDLIDSIN